MAERPYGDASPESVRIEAEASHERSLGEHIFIWIGWALAAAFWGATLTGGVGILRAAIGGAGTTISAPGAPGGMGFLALVVLAFLLVAVAMLYAQLCTARMGPLESLSERRTAALYDRIEGQDDDNATIR
jgi:hypothetical protein